MDVVAFYFYEFSHMVDKLTYVFNKIIACK